LVQRKELRFRFNKKYSRSKKASFSLDERTRELKNREDRKSVPISVYEYVNQVSWLYQIDRSTKPITRYLMNESNWNSFKEGSFEINVRKIIHLVKEKPPKIFLFEDKLRQINENLHDLSERIEKNILHLLNKKIENIPDQYHDFLMVKRIMFPEQIYDSTRRNKEIKKRYQKNTYRKMNLNGWYLNNRKNHSRIGEKEKVKAPRFIAEECLSSYRCTGSYREEGAVEYV
jgi:hypothetical protein